MPDISKKRGVFCPCRWRIGLVAAAFGVLLCVLAAPAPTLAQALSFQIYDQQSGLANAAINSLAQDSAGFLYAATEDGLYRYDGSHFTRLGARDGLPATGSVEAVRASPDGRVWAVFAGRVYLFGAGSTVSAPLEAASDDHYAHRADVLGQDLLLVRNGRLLRIHPGPDGVLGVSPMLPDALPGPHRATASGGIDIVHVDHGEIWLGCGTAICRLDPGRGMLVLNTASGLPADRWTALLRDSAGTLWVRSAAHIASLPRGAARFTVIDAPGGAGRFASDPGALDLVEDAAGDVTTQSAVGLAVHEHGQWVVFGRGESLSYTAATAMLVDREGSLWIGTEGRGVARAVGLGLLESWTRAQGLSDNLIWNARRDGAGTLWVADDLAVDALVEPDRPQTAPPGLSPRNPGTPDPSLHYPVRAFAMAVSPQGRLWIGQQDGSLLRRDPATGQSRTMAQVASIRVMATDRAGALWIGTIGGLLRIDHPDAPATPIVSDILPSRERVFSIRFDAAGELWVLTERTLFHRDAAQRWHAVLHIDSRGGYQTRSMAFAPDGTLWLGSYTTGITRLHLEHGHVVASDRGPSAHLASLNVELLHRDAAGRIWIGTDQGLDVTDGRNWRHLDDQDGLATDDVDENAAFTDDDGTSWFGLAGGLAHLIEPQRLFTDRPRSLHPVITRLSVGGRPQSFGRNDASKPLRLHGATDPLVIGFASLDFRYAKSISFRYRLRGVDPGWVETTAHEVRYPNPPSGTLVFEVMAVDAVHATGSKPARLMLRIRPPWWRNWRTDAAILMLAILLVVLIWRLRVSYLIERQHQLEALVQERTREIEEARIILFKQAMFDALTGLLNRPAVMDRLRLAMEQARASGSPLALALLDLDHFKRINDEFGHLGGDAVLAEIGRRLGTGIRETDSAGRYGGEELLLVLPGLRSGAFERIEALRDAVFAAPIAFEGSAIAMTCSMGVTWLRSGDDVTGMVRRADAALYAAKRNGRDRIVFDPPLAASRR